MNDSAQIKEFAKHIIKTEADSVTALIDFIDDSFVQAVTLIFNNKGRLIVTGIGKSAIIASKIVATLNSTGTPAIFMHAADAIHGDLGIVQPEDIIMCLSKSGNTPEIKVLIPFIKRRGNKIIAMVGSKDSFLAKNADYILNTYVKAEACPNNLAPTASTTAQLVMGDALAMTLLKMRGFTAEDFGRSHPGGALGKKIYTRVRDIMSTDLVPRVTEETSLENVIIEISSKFLGATAVMDNNGKLEGIITDGDLRRMLQRNVDIRQLKAKEIMTMNPKTINADELAINAFNMMEKNKITQLVVLDGDKYLGMIHIHDILREGII